MLLATLFLLVLASPCVASASDHRLYNCQFAGASLVKEADLDGTSVYLLGYWSINKVDYRDGNNWYTTCQPGWYGDGATGGWKDLQAFASTHEDGDYLAYAGYDESYLFFSVSDHTWIQRLYNCQYSGARLTRLADLDGTSVYLGGIWSINKVDHREGSDWHTTCQPGWYGDADTDGWKDLQVFASTHEDGDYLAYAGYDEAYLFFSVSNHTWVQRLYNCQFYGATLASEAEFDGTSVYLLGYWSINKVDHREGGDWHTTCQPDWYGDAATDGWKNLQEFASTHEDGDYLAFAGYDSSYLFFSVLDHALSEIGGGEPGTRWVRIDDEDGADIMASSWPGSNALKHVPQGWILQRVDSGNTSGAYAEILDVTDGLSGWVLNTAVSAAANGQRAEEIISVDDRGAAIIDAIQAFVHVFLPRSVPPELVLAICFQETGPGYSWDNTVISNDCGRGIMQITTPDYVGAGSGINCYNACNTKTCPPEDCLCHYTNTIQGIEANIKDGLYALREKYPALCPRDDIILDGYTFTCEEIERIRMVWGYQGLVEEYTFNGQRVPSTYMADVANRLECLGQAFPGQSYADADNFIAKLRVANNNKRTVRLYSPCELYIKDGTGAITGLVRGHLYEEIRASIFDVVEEAATILLAKEPLTYNVRGTANGAYDMRVAATHQGTFTTFRANGIETAPGVIHQYQFDWEELSEEGDGATVRIDANGDGEPETTVFADADLTADEVKLQTETEVDFVPDVLNLKNKGRFVWASVRLPGGFNASDIDVSTMRLNDVVPGLTRPWKMRGLLGLKCVASAFGELREVSGSEEGFLVRLASSDAKKRGCPLVAKFDRQEVCALLSPGEQTIEVSGRLKDGTLFAGTDTIKVVDGFKWSDFWSHIGQNERATSGSPETPSQTANKPPVANAGSDIRILSVNQATTIVRGTATDPDGDTLQFRWLDADYLLLGWLEVGAGGDASVALGPLDALAIGDHSLTLEVTDGHLTEADSMVLTVENTPPKVQVAKEAQSVTVDTDPIVLTANVSDFDGDTLQYEWLKGKELIGGGTVATPQGGETVTLPEVAIPPGDARFPVGRHNVTVRVYDGANDPVSASVTVGVVRRSSWR